MYTVDVNNINNNNKKTFILEYYCGQLLKYNYKTLIVIPDIKNMLLRSPSTDTNKFGRDAWGKKYL